MTMNRRMKISAVLLIALLVSKAVWPQKSPSRHFALVAGDLAFWALFDRNAKLRTIGSNFGFTEGPVWDRAGFLWVSDEEQNSIYRLYPDSHREEMITLGDPDGSTYDRAHRDLPV